MVSRLTGHPYCAESSLELWWHSASCRKSARLIFITTCFIQFIITGGEINQIDRYCFDISKRKQPFTEIDIIYNNFNIFVWFNRLSVLVTQMMNDRFQFHSFLRFINQKLDGAKNISRACFTMLWFCVPWMKLMSPSCGCLWVNVSATSAFYWQLSVVFTRFKPVSIQCWSSKSFIQSKFSLWDNPRDLAIIQTFVVFMMSLIPSINIYKYLQMV